VYTLCSPSGRQKVNIDANVAYMTLRRYAEVHSMSIICSTADAVSSFLCQGRTNYTRHLPCMAIFSLRHFPYPTQPLWSVSGLIAFVPSSVPSIGRFSAWPSFVTFWTTRWKITRCRKILHGANIHNENLKFRSVGMKHMTFSSLFIACPWNFSSSITGSIVWPYAFK